MRALLSSESPESSSKWQFKCYLLSCSNFIIWLGKMRHIILVILLPSLCYGGHLAVLSLAKQIHPVQELILFLILAPEFVLPFYLLLHGDQ